MDVPCPACHTSVPILYLAGDDNEISIESVGASRTLLSHGRILRCTSCGLAYRSLRPKGEQLAHLYREADDSRYEAEMPNRSRTAMRHKKIVEKHVSRKGSLLDVGCASGAFLRLMRDSGWDVHGVEPSEAQFRRASKLLGENARIRQCVLQEARFPTDFDLVTLWDVLEHVTEPVEFMALAATHLKRGGLLILNVPRIDSFAAKVLGSRWPVLLAEHLCYFTIPSLHLCGEGAGLQMVCTGQRPVTFSLGYISFRASQHGIPGSAIVDRVLKNSKVAGWSIPLWLGEIYAVFRKI